MQLIYRSELIITELAHINYIYRQIAAKKKTTFGPTENMKVQ